jgi:hypothetical protein
MRQTHGVLAAERHVQRKDVNKARDVQVAPSRSAPQCHWRAATSGRERDFQTAHDPNG